MKSFIEDIILALIILGSSNDSSASPEQETPPRRSIVIKESVIKIDGKEVWLGDKVENWLAAIPGKARCSHETNSLKFCVWDDLGLEIGTNLEDTTRVKFANINLAFDRSTAPSDRLPSAPTGVFVGHLELDGFQFDAKTEFRQIGLHAARNRELTCGGRSCGSPYGLFSKAARLYFDLDRGSDRGFVVTIYISCSSTAKCADLIPSNRNQQN
jgi:hypothetical protein